MTILIADDDKNILTLLTAVLSREGFSILTAGDGAEALDVFLDRHIDMLICDEMMPNLSGNELVREVRKMSRELPVIMVTAKDAIGDKGISFESGVDDYMVKPVDCDELLMRVRAVFRRAKIRTDRKIVVDGTVLDSDTHTVSHVARGQSVTLTKTQFGILFKLLLYPEKVFSKWQLFHEFWGVDSEVDDGIVKVFISQIRKQIEPFPEIGIKTVMGIGYQGCVMKRRSSRYFLRVLLNTLVGYLLAAAIIFAVLIVLLLLNVGIESWEAILLIIGAVCCGIAVSAVMTYYAMKKQTQLIRDIDRVLDAISEGDLTARLPLTRYDVHLDKIITKFNAAIGELNSVAILKSDFIRNFSHEFKTPIASIKGFAELLYRDKALSQEEQERYCKIIAEESARLSRLAEMTLLFGKFDAQNIILDREPCYLDEEIGECILELYEAADKKGQTVEIEIGHIAVSASKALSRQLWINLFSNAVKYTGEHGHIALSARENAEEIVVSFRDDGIGMTEETMKHIFLAYYQADASRHGHGIGLGLAICKRIADLHGWKIEVSSEFGKGSTFSVHIPRTVPEAEGSASETEKVSHESVGLHTL